MNVREIMTRPPIATGENGTLVGVVGRADIMRLMAREAAGSA